MTAGRITRRGLLAGGLTALAGAALAEGPLTTLRPPTRGGLPVGTGGPTRPSVSPALRREIADIVRASGLEGRVGIAVVDMRTGTILDAVEPTHPLPPASVAKAVTALYAIETLGPDHRFRTRLLATGPVADGVVQGDLILAGSGDPVLTTDRLADLARLLREAGVTGAQGFRVWGGALPYTEEIAPDQLDHLAYNPSISGLNLNFNRVFFAWARSGSGWRLTLDARGDNHRPEVQVARITAEPRSLPVYTYRREDGVDVWTVAARQLGDSGSRWLPVRDPALYAGQAFRGLAAGAGVTLPAPTAIEALPEGATEVAALDSDPLEAIVIDMLRYSTNLTAEVVGLAASQARGLTPASPEESAAAMNRWIGERTGARMRLVDHSGLGVESRMTAQEMAIMLAAPGVMGVLRPLLRDIPLTDPAGAPLRLPPAIVRAKTGTLNFVSTLAGYARTTPGADLAFAIFAADPERRAAAASASDEEIPPGSRDWIARARRLQQTLLQRWGTIS
jgi:D-alanyl-D-alanine carboxypeptidase/D-alanyl-D-alanine-endopeptidase (penicillin-binding protein 4)